MRCPLAIWRPIHANNGPAIGAPKGLVLHDQEGNGSLWGWFNQASTKASAHFWLAKDGTAEQYVDTDLAAWAQAAGNTPPSGPYLSIETEGFATEALTQAQLLSLSRFVQWMRAVYSMPMLGPVPHGDLGFTTHCNPDGTPDPSWGNHPCPGPIRLGQVPTILALANGAPIEPPQGEEMAHWQAGGQDHVSGIIGAVALHWWQNTPGTAPEGAPADYYAWHVEALPLPK